MNNQTIKSLALANGFKLKKQGDGSLDLNPYVYEFANALMASQLRLIREAIQPDGLINSEAGVKTIAAITSALDKEIELTSK